MHSLKALTLLAAYVHIILSFSTVQGPISYSVGDFAEFAVVSKDANTYIMCFGTSKDLEIWRNTGSGFELKQTLAGTSDASHPSISDSGKLLSYSI